MCDSAPQETPTHSSPAIKTKLPSGPNETPYLLLYYEGETAEGRQTQAQRPGQTVPLVQPVPPPPFQTRVVQMFSYMGH